MSVSPKEAEKRWREKLPSAQIPQLETKDAVHAVERDVIAGFLTKLPPFLQEVLKKQGEYGVLVIGKDRVNRGENLLTIEVLGPKG